MNVLDENILVDQRQVLRRWRIPVRQIGYDLGRKGMQDDQIIRLLLKLRRPTFFTRDYGFYERRLCHAQYAIAMLAVDKNEPAGFIRRLLRHPMLNTEARRMGSVMRVSSAGISAYHLQAEAEAWLNWPA